MVKLQSKEERNRNTFRQWLAAHSAHNILKMLETLADDIILDSALWSRPKIGKEEAARFWENLFSTFPDWKAKPKNMMVGEDFIVTELQITGTHRGRLGDIEPTGKQISLPAALICFFRKGKFIKMISYFDNATILKQIGLLPTTLGK